MAEDHASHVWPCTRFYVTSTDWDRCTCPVSPPELGLLVQELRERSGLEREGMLWSAAHALEELTRRHLALQNAYGQVVEYADRVLAERNTAEAALGRPRV